MSLDFTDWQYGIKEHLRDSTNPPERRHPMKLRGVSFLHIVGKAAMFGALLLPLPEESPLSSHLSGSSQGWIDLAEVGGLS